MKKSKGLALLLAIIMALSTLPVNAMAENELIEEQQAEIEIISFEALADDVVSMEVGSQLPAMPEALTGNDASEGKHSIPVTWKCEAFDANTVGEYMFTAVLSAPESGRQTYGLEEKLALPQLKVNRSW